MMRRLKYYWWIVSGAVAAILYTLWQRALRKNAQQELDERKREAEALRQVSEQREKADKASQKSKEKGDAKAKEAVDRARAGGKRDHFE